MATAPHAPASASGGRISTTAAGSSWAAAGEAVAQARELGVDGRGEDRSGVGHAATDDDPLDVVGHDQQVDGPGQPPADLLDQGQRSRVAGGGPS